MELIFTSYVEMNVILSKLILSFTIDEGHEDQVSFFVLFIFSTFSMTSNVTASCSQEDGCVR
jgi:hypothetical protein